MTPTIPQLATSPGLKTPGNAGELLSSLAGKSNGESFDSLISRAVSSGGARSKSPDSDGQTPAQGESKTEPGSGALSLEAALIFGGDLTVPVAPPVATLPNVAMPTGAGLKALVSQAPAGRQLDAMAGNSTAADSPKVAVPEATQGKIMTTGEQKGGSEKTLMAAINPEAAKESANPTAANKALAKPLASSVSSAVVTDLKGVVSPVESMAIPDAKGAVNAPAKELPGKIEATDSADSTAGNSVEIDSINAGTPIAKLSAAMKKPEQTIRIAGATGNFLPGSAASIGAKSDLLAQAGNISANAVGAVQANTDSGQAIVTDAVPAPVDARSRTVERTQEMVVQHAMRLSNSTADSLQVVIRPGTGTQLSLELRQRGGTVEVQAVLQQGDFNQLNQNWGDLQQQLQQRGIQLGALLDGNDLLSHGDAQLQQGQNGTGGSLENEAPVLATSGGLAQAAGNLVANVPGPAGARGWQMWA